MFVMNARMVAMSKRYDEQAMLTRNLVNEKRMEKENVQVGEPREAKPSLNVACTQRKEKIHVWQCGVHSHSD
jgi:hypothetical protein